MELTVVKLSSRLDTGLEMNTEHSHDAPAILAFARLSAGLSAVSTRARPLSYWL